MPDHALVDEDVTIVLSQNQAEMLRDVLGVFLPSLMDTPLHSKRAWVDLWTSIGEQIRIPENSSS